VDPQPGTPLKCIVDTGLPLFKKIMDRLPKIPVAICKLAMDENKKEVHLFSHSYPTSH
jgi:hypothetical protein